MIKIVDMEAIRNAPPIKDSELSAATPRRVDERCARLDSELSTAHAVISASVRTAHDIAGDRGRGAGKRKQYELSHTDAEKIMREKVTADTVDLSYRSAAPGVVKRLDEARDTVLRIEAERDQLDAEYDRRPWTRFITVAGGHIHSGRWCVAGTIRPTTDVNWTPLLSGMNEVTALTYLAEYGHALCTHCFPNAPVIKPTTQKHCTGKGGWYKPGTHKRGYPNGTGECPECDKRVPLTPNGYIRAHPPRPTEPTPAPPSHD